MGLIKGYSDFVSKHPFVVLAGCILLTLAMFVGMQLMETPEMDYQDMLPEDYDVIRAFNLISDDFGGTTSGTVVLYVDDSYANSNEHRSVLDSEVVRYSKTIEDYFSYVGGVESVSGFGNVVYSVYGEIPNEQVDIYEVFEAQGSSYVSEDESILLVTLTLDEDADGGDVTYEVMSLLENIDSPVGISTGLIGEVFEDVVVDEQLGPDMNRTSMFSMGAIVIILFLLFRSIKGVAIPLMTIIFGVIWTMGFLGFIGSGLSSMTSGAISMIMGIGIDFGIQVMSRYNRELKENEKRIAMSRTLQGILVPILTTAMACLIGFRAMGLGELSMMAQLGEVMSYGVLFCMLAAVTLVPSLLVILTRKKR